MYHIWLQKVQKIGAQRTPKCRTPKIAFELASKRSTRQRAPRSVVESPEIDFRSADFRVMQKKLRLAVVAGRSRLDVLSVGENLWSNDGLEPCEELGGGCASDGGGDRRGA